jgi:hypothetical protein
MDFFKNIKSIFSLEGNSSRNIWSENELLDFQNNLLQVITWTDQLSKNFDFTNGKYGLVFRQTNPIINGIPMYKFGKQSDEITRLDLAFDFGEDYSSWNNWDYSFEGYDFLLGEAIKARTSNRNIDLSELDKLGRIISFQTFVTTHDGAPIVESKNFVDEADVPPIDTWFYLKRNYLHSEHRCDQSLFCWIPKKFEAVMQQAIDVEIVDSYRWFDENNKDIYEQIKNSR